MKRFAFLWLSAICWTGLIWAQASWQGDVKRYYPVPLPAYKGKELVLTQMAAHKGDPAIEGYTTYHHPADAGPVFVFYRDHLMKLGFKEVPGPGIKAKGQQRVDLYWPEKNWNAVVMTTPYPDNRVSLGISITAKKK